MRKSIQPVSLNILGKEYKIACPADETESLIRTAEELDRQMRIIRNTGKVAGTEKIAVLAALNLAHDTELAGNDTELCRRLADLRQKIENVLESQ